MTRRVDAAIVAVLVSFTVMSAYAQRIGPSFECPRPAPADGVAQMICDHADASREELRFEQPYYALRWLLGKSAWKDIKLQAIAINNQLRVTCGFPPAGQAEQTMPADADQCYLREAEKGRDILSARLTSDAHEEISHSVEQQIAEQQRLIQLGYLPAGTTADGIFGEGTRAGIVTWQRVTHQPSTDGFISNADAVALQASSAQGSPGEPQPQAPADTSPPSQPPVAAATSSPNETTTAPQAQKPLLSVEEVIAQIDELAGQDVRIRGDLSCIDQSCDVRQPDGMSSISFDPAGFDSGTRIELLHCGSFSVTCSGWIAGTVQRSEFGTINLIPSAINLGQAPAPSD